MSDPTLLAARVEIEEILKRHDIAAHVILHNAPGKLEIFSRFDPSYSCLVGLPPVVRLRSKLVEDYGGDKEAQRRDQAATANMVSGIAVAMGNGAMVLLDLSTWIDEALGAEHGGLVPDPDPQVPS